MVDIKAQLDQLVDDVAVASRIDDKRMVFAEWFAFSCMLAVPLGLGAILPELFIKLAALTSIVAGILYGIMSCSLKGVTVGLGLGLTGLYGGDIMSAAVGPEFQLFDSIILLYLGIMICLFAFLPYLTSMLIYLFWSFRKRNIPGMSFFDGFDRSTYDKVNRFQKSIANDDVIDYIETRKEKSSYLYKFELTRLEAINDQFSTGVSKTCEDWQPRAREKKCIDCKLKGVCPFQPGAPLDHLGDGHL